MMTTMKRLLCAAFLLLLLVNVISPVECRRHREPRKDYMLFVFGDAFVDAGNVPKPSAPSRMSRGWYHPYGSSDTTHDNAATGRVSDGLVQSDFLGKMLGNDESPPPYRLRKRNKVDPSGVNFAQAFSGVLNGPEEVSPVGRQIDQFRTLVNRGTIDDQDLQDSVALLSVAGGHDYSHLSDTTSADEMNAYIGRVTDEIVDAVKRLQDLGVSKVLVNSMPPLGCAPWRTRPSNYASCDSRSNAMATAHNTVLKHKLDGLDDGVLLLDLYTAFHDAMGGSSSSRAPCCDTADPNGYCGQVDGSGRALYTVCANPSSSFYWDYLHPTQAAWSSVMGRLQGTINDFLGI